MKRKLCLIVCLILTLTGCTNIQPVEDTEISKIEETSTGSKLPVDVSIITDKEGFNKVVQIDDIEIELGTLTLSEFENTLKDKNYELGHPELLEVAPYHIYDSYSEFYHEYDDKRDGIIIVSTFNNTENIQSAGDCIVTGITVISDIRSVNNGCEDIQVVEGDWSYVIQNIAEYGITAINAYPQITSVSEFFLKDTTYLPETDKPSEFGSGVVLMGGVPYDIMNATLAEMIQSFSLGNIEPSVISTCPRIATYHNLDSSMSMITDPLTVDWYGIDNMYYLVADTDVVNLASDNNMLNLYESTLDDVMIGISADTLSGFEYAGLTSGDSLEDVKSKIVEYEDVILDTSIEEAGTDATIICETTGYKVVLYILWMVYYQL